MKRLVQTTRNIGIIFTVSVLTAVLMHFTEARGTIETKTLLNLFLIACATQVVSAVMDHITLRPVALHMFTELILMEGLVLSVGSATGIFNFEESYYVLIDILIIAFIYAFTAAHYWISAKFAADEINQYLQNKKRGKE